MGGPLYLDNLEIESKNRRFRVFLLKMIDFNLNEFVLYSMEALYIPSL